MIDIDGTLIDVHSEKELATLNYKRGFGFHPLVAISMPPAKPWPACCVGEGRGSATVEDHICVLDAALARLPLDPVTCALSPTCSLPRRGNGHGKTALGSMGLAP